MAWVKHHQWGNMGARHDERQDGNHDILPHRLPGPLGRIKWCTVAVPWQGVTQEQGNAGIQHEYQASQNIFSTVQIIEKGVVLHICDSFTQDDSMQAVLSNLHCASSYPYPHR